MKTYLITLFICLCAFNPIECQIPLIDNQNTEQTDFTPSPFDRSRSETRVNDLPTPYDPFETSHTGPVIEPDSFQKKFWNMLVVLGLLIGFMILASWMLKRMMHTRTNKINEGSSIQILETRSLSTRSTLYLIDVEGQKLVLAETPTHVSHLATLNSKYHAPTPSNFS